MDLDKFHRPTLAIRPSLIQLVAVDYFMKVQELLWGGEPYSASSPKLQD